MLNLISNSDVCNSAAIICYSNGLVIPSNIAKAMGVLPKVCHEIKGGMKSRQGTIILVWMNSKPGDYYYLASRPALVDLSSSPGYVFSFGDIAKFHKDQTCYHMMRWRMVLCKIFTIIV